MLSLCDALREDEQDVCLTSYLIMVYGYPYPISDITPIYQISASLLLTTFISEEVGAKHHATDRCLYQEAQEGAQGYDTHSFATCPPQLFPTLTSLFLLSSSGENNRFTTQTLGKP